MIHIYADFYGLFRSVAHRNIGIVHGHRATKYLLAHRYIPSRFDGILIGDSTTGGIDPSHFTSYRIYNAALPGGNISEGSIIANLAARDRVRFVIFGLSPEFTDSSGPKTRAMDKRTRRQALGSLSTLQIQIKRSMRKGRNREKISWAGYVSYCPDEILSNKRRNEIVAEAQTQPPIPFSIDDQGFSEFKSLLATLRSKRIKILAFFYPLPYNPDDLVNYYLQQYQETLSSLFLDSDIVLDFNDEKYFNLTKNYSNYCDGLHLDEFGAALVAKEIESQMARFSPDILL